MRRRTPGLLLRRLPLLLLFALLANPVAGEATPDNEPVYEKPPPPPSSGNGGGGGGGGSAPPPRESIELELALLVDSSSSVTDEEYELQRQGYVDALRNPEVQAAIVACDGVLLRYAVWSGRDQINGPWWTLLRTVKDCEDLAERLTHGGRRYRHDTNMAFVLEHTLYQMNTNRFDSARQVIDISGDGVCRNEFYYRNGGTYDKSFGRPWQEVLQARQPTTTINAISIGADPDLIRWYDETVPQGEDSFSMNAKSFEAFGNAIKQKLLMEIGKPIVGYD